MIRALLKDPRMTRSEKERALLKLIDAAQLPRPVTNGRLHGYLVDAYWPAAGLIVEFDGWGAHGNRLAFESNRKRDQVLLAHGIRVLRVTGRQLEDWIVDAEDPPPDPERLRAETPAKIDAWNELGRTLCSAFLAAAAQRTASLA